MKYYETSRREFYKKSIQSMSEQIADIISDGAVVQISRSRSGLKINKVIVVHEVVQKNYSAVKKGE